jgi:alpha/beta superfamily hydrolase
MDSLRWLRSRELWLALVAGAALTGIAGAGCGTPPAVVSGSSARLAASVRPSQTAIDPQTASSDPIWVLLSEDTGPFKLEYTPAVGASSAILWLSGTDGGIDGPFAGFYSRLARSLQRQGIASAQLEYSHPGDFETSLGETRGALDYMESSGLQEIAIVGFSFGGGLAVEAAAERSEIRTAIVLSGQGFGTDRVAQIAPRPLLIVHTEGDMNIPIEIARNLLDRAGAHSELVELPSNDHYLEDVARPAQGLVRRWLTEWLNDRRLG